MRGDIGVVVIGRNEGERLRRCLTSVMPGSTSVVYVDSGSGDGSLEMARGLGAEVLLLDTRLPFTAARARNEGWRALLQAKPSIEWVQFVDGDCEVAAGWMETARQFLAANERVAAVCGRRRERFPDKSVYNRLCDIEWDTPVGNARACGGDAMMRMSALLQVQGFRPDLIAGEEPELCVRLRGQGWAIWRLDAEMTLHDAAMTRFSQWWRRSMRAGYAYAQGAGLHGKPPERHWVRESRSAWFWGLGWPVTLLLAALVSPLALWGLLIYPVQVVRLALRGGAHRESRWSHALFLVLGKFAEAAGQARYMTQRYRGGTAHLIEYK